MHTGSEMFTVVDGLNLKMVVEAAISCLGLVYCLEG
jgi:hypothetical protein